MSLISEDEISDSDDSHSSGNESSTNVSHNDKKANIKSRQNNVPSRRRVSQRLKRRRISDRDPGNMNEKNIVHCKRKRNKVDYRKLNDVLFGDWNEDEVAELDGGEDFEIISSRIKKEIVKQKSLSNKELSKNDVAKKNQIHDAIKKKLTPCLQTDSSHDKNKNGKMKSNTVSAKKNSKNDEKLEEEKKPSKKKAKNESTTKMEANDTKKNAQKISLRTISSTRKISKPTISNGANHKVTKVVAKANSNNIQSKTNESKSTNINNNKNPIRKTRQMNKFKTNQIDKKVNKSKSTISNDTRNARKRYVSKVDL